MRGCAKDGEGGARRRKIFKFGPPLDPPFAAPPLALPRSSSPFSLKLLPLFLFQANWRADYS